MSKEQSLLPQKLRTDRAYILQTGRISGEGTGRELLDSDLFRSAFLGI